MPLQYESPALAFQNGMDDYLAKQAAMKHQALVDQIAMQEAALRRDREKRLADREEQKLKWEMDDRAKKDVQGRVAGLQRGDIADPELKAAAKKYGVPLPTEPELAGAAFLTPGGFTRQDPTAPQPGAYLGTHQEQTQAQDLKNRTLLANQMEQPGASVKSVMPMAVRLGMTKELTPLENIEARKESQNEALQLRRDLANQSDATKRDIESMKEDFRRELADAKKDKEGAPILSPQGMALAAKLYAKTGQLPPMGMGAAGASVRSSIINMAANYDAANDTFKDPKTGKVTPGGIDIASNKAAFHANEQTLTQLKKNQAAVEAFAKTANRNADILESTLKKLPDSGTKFLNTPIRNLMSQMGSTDLQAFQTMLPSVRAEYARLIQQPSLTGVLSDTARKEVGDTLPENATIAQMRTALKFLKAESDNRRKSIEEQIKETQSAIKGSSDRSTKTADDYLNDLFPVKK